MTPEISKPKNFYERHTLAMYIKTAPMTNAETDPNRFLRKMRIVDRTTRGPVNSHLRRFTFTTAPEDKEI
jgi:hypothetical protein